MRIQGPNYASGSKKGFHVMNILRCCIMMVGKFEGVPDVPAGNTVAFVGIDQFFMKQGTLTTDENAHKIKVMKYSVSPVVRVAF